MGSPGEPVSASGRLCTPRAPFRGEPHPRLDAGRSTGQLDRWLRASCSGVRYLLVPRQYRRGADRRDRCTACVQGSRPHRLPRGNCRRRQRRRRGQRHRRPTTTMLWIAGDSPLPCSMLTSRRGVPCSSLASRRRAPNRDTRQRSRIRHRAWASRLDTLPQ